MFFVVIITAILGFGIFNFFATKISSWAATNTHGHVREVDLSKNAAVGSLLIPPVAESGVRLEIFLNYSRV